MAADPAVLAHLADSTADEALAAEMRDQGREEAYAALVERYSALVLAYCRSRVCRPGDAEDAAQDVWLKVWAFREQYVDQGPTSFRRWLFTVAGRTCIDTNRKKRPDLPSDDYFANVGDSERAAPDWMACLSERRQVLEGCISRLSSRQQCVVRATLEGDKTGAAAEKCECSAAQASTAKHQAIKALRECTASTGL